MIVGAGIVGLLDGDGQPSAPDGAGRATEHLPRLFGKWRPVFPLWRFGDFLSKEGELALVGIGLVAWAGGRRHQHGSTTTPHDFESSEESHRFLWLPTLLLTAFHTIVTLLAAMVAFFFEDGQ